MYTVFVAPSHLLPVRRQMPTLKDPLGGGFYQVRRRFTAPVGEWEINVAGYHENLDAMSGLLEYVQGDTPLWFDGAGFGSVTEPVPIGEGDGVTTDYKLMHRHAFSASIVAYRNGIVDTGWSPIGNGIICDAIRFTVAPVLNDIVSAIYTRKVKVLLQTETDFTQERQFRSATDPGKSISRIKYVLYEVPF